METNDGEETLSRGNEWEVVSLTASGYAAVPGSKEDDSEHDIHTKLSSENEAETSSAMFMSGHFVFPPSDHENLPLGPQYREIHYNIGVKDDDPRLVSEKGKPDLTDGENVSVDGWVPDEFLGIPDKIRNQLSIHGPNFYQTIAFDKEQSIFSSAEFSSVYSDSILEKSNNMGEGERSDDAVECIDHVLESSLQNHTDGGNHDDVGLPCRAWWKRRAVSLYTHAKEANTFWSVCIATAVLGLVIIGQRWQQERWQILHHKWLFTVKNERMGMVLDQMSRLKAVLVGGHPRGSLITGSTSP